VSADSGLDDALLRPATRFPCAAILAGTRYTAWPPRLCHGHPSLLWLPPRLARFYISSSWEIHAPLVHTPNGLWGEVNCWPPKRQRAAWSTSSLSHGTLTDVLSLSMQVADLN
jgi:hypothetical protein